MSSQNDVLKKSVNIQMILQFYNSVIHGNEKGSDMNKTKGGFGTDQNSVVAVAKEYLPVSAASLL